MVFQKIHESFQPWLYQELFQLKPDLKKIKESTRLLFISLKLVTIMGMIVIPFALEAIFPKYFFGQKQFIQILCLFPFINASKSLAVSLLMKNESGGYFISFGTYLFIFLLFLFGFLLIPFFGITGAASSLVLSRYLSSELTIYFLLRDKNMKYISYFNKNRQTIIPIYLICLINLFINILFGVNLDMLPTFILICLLIFLIFFHKNDLKIIINTLKFW
jgi:O-antigen/teichoic acid export membrane protein